MPTFSGRSFVQQWGLIHISVYSAVTGVGLESEGKTFLLLFILFCVTAHLKAIVCIFLVLVNWKTVMLCLFWTQRQRLQMGEEWVRHNSNLEIKSTSLFFFISYLFFFSWCFSRSLVLLQSIKVIIMQIFPRVIFYVILLDYLTDVLMCDNGAFYLRRLAEAETF